MRNRKLTRSFLSLLLLLVMLLSFTGCEQKAAHAGNSPTTMPENWPPIGAGTEIPTEETTPWPSKPSVDATTGATQQEQQPQGGGTTTPTQPQQGSTQPSQDDPTQPAGQDDPIQPTQPAQTEDDQPVQTEPTTPAPTEPVTPPPYNANLKVHFIDVGQADAILVTCQGKTMLVDGGNAADSNVMYAYLKKNGITHLDYVIGTHAHEDHIGGIPGALQYATVGKVYCPSTSYNSKAFNNFVKAVQNRGASITVPSVGTSFMLGSAQVKMVAVNSASGTNNTSIVLRITFGSTSFLLMGDAEREVEQALINSGAATPCTVLKVGHHGSNSSTSYQFLWNIMPQYSVICVGKGNTYGHPTSDVLSRLRDADTTLYRTDMQGDIICTSNGSTVSFTVSRNANADTFVGA